MHISILDKGFSDKNGLRGQNLYSPSLLEARPEGIDGQIYSEVLEKKWEDNVQIRRGQKKGGRYLKWIKLAFLKDSVGLAS